MNSAITINHTFNTNENDTKLLLWNTSNSKSTMGHGNFSRKDVSTICGNESHCSNNIDTSRPTCQPRRVSFTQQDSCQDNYERLISLLQPGNRKTKKSVRFSSQQAIDTPSNRQEGFVRKSWNGILTDEHCNELWYQKKELVAIKQAAKVLIANRSKIQRNPDASSEERDNLVGLERFIKQRASWKKSSIRFVLMAQNQMRELHAQSINIDYGISKEDYMRDISLRCSEWALEAAEMQGFRDYCAVHDPLASLFSDSEFNDGCTYLDDNKKEEQNYNELIFGETTACNTSNKRQFGAVCEPCNEQTQIDSLRRVRSRTATLQSI